MDFQTKLPLLQGASRAWRFDLHNFLPFASTAPLPMVVFFPIISVGRSFSWVAFMSAILISSWSFPSIVSTLPAPRHYTSWQYPQQLQPKFLVDSWMLFESKNIIRLCNPRKPAIRPAPCDISFLYAAIWKCKHRFYVTSIRQILRKGIFRQLLPLLP